MTARKTTFDTLELYRLGETAMRIKGPCNISYDVAKKYVVLFKLLRRGSSIAEICRRTRWSKKTVVEVVQWSVEAAPDFFSPIDEKPEAANDAGKSVEVARDAVAAGRADHPEILTRLARLFDEQVLIPPATRISGLDLKEWSVGYYGGLDKKPSLAIESDPLFEEVVADYEVAGFETAVDCLKSDLLKYSNHAQKLFRAITGQIGGVEQDKTEAPKFRQVPEGMTLAVMHWSIERAAGNVSDSPPMPVTGDEAAGFVLELGGWRAVYDGRAHALIDADRFGSAVDQASDLDEIAQVEESRARCERALAAVIRTLKPSDRKKI